MVYLSSEKQIPFVGSMGPLFGLALLLYAYAQGL